MMEGSEIAQYHQKVKQDKSTFEVFPMTSLINYLTPMGYEVFAIGSLMRGLEVARTAYEATFNRSYNFTLEPLETAFTKLQTSETFLVRLTVEPLTAVQGDIPFVPFPGTDVFNSKQECEIHRKNAHLLLMNTV